MVTDVVIVGAGQAGLTAAAKLRTEGYDGRLVMIGGEVDPPYQRPPLSKKYLTGEMERKRLYLRPADFYQSSEINLRLGLIAYEIDRETRLLKTSEGDLRYDALLLATGVKPRALPAGIGGELDGVFTMRYLPDADAIAPHLVADAKLLTIGGGYIGLEMAAVAATRGLKVTLVEMAPRILQRVATEDTASYFRDLHTNHGVEIIEGVGLERLTGIDNVNGAVLSDGRNLEVDFVVVGIGISPNVSLAEAAGLAIDNGIETDALGQTSDPAIWAAGDCASLPYTNYHIRLESVPNAIGQAEAVAMNILGANKEYVPDIWFQSDQYNTKLQIAGLNAGYTDVIERPSDKSGSASFWYFHDDTLISVDAMNDPRSYMIGKRLIAVGNSPAKGAIADPTTDLKTLQEEIMRTKAAVAVGPGKPLEVMEVNLDVSRFDAAPLIAFIAAKETV